MAIWVKRLASAIFCIILARGILLWLAAKQVHPEEWMAAMIGHAESALAQEAIQWIFLGIAGLLGLAFGPSIAAIGTNKWRRWFMETSGSEPKLKLEFEPTDKYISDTRVHFQRRTNSLSYPVLISTTSSPTILDVSSGSTVSQQFTLSNNDDRPRSKWIHVIVSAIGQSPVSECNVKLSNIEKWSDQKHCFESTKYNVPQTLSWSGIDGPERYSSKTLKVGDPMPVDVFFVVEGRSNLFLSVETPLAANENIFKDIGVYRLTVIAVSVELGSPEKICLIIKWNGVWDNFVASKEDKRQP